MTGAVALAWVHYTGKWVGKADNVSLRLPRRRLHVSKSSRISIHLWGSPASPKDGCHKQEEETGNWPRLLHAIP